MPVSHLTAKAAKEIHGELYKKKFTQTMWVSVSELTTKSSKEIQDKPNKKVHFDDVVVSR